MKVDVYRKPTHTNQYLRFDSHHPLEHKLGVIRTLHRRENTIPTDSVNVVTPAGLLSKQDLQNTLSNSRERKDIRCLSETLGNPICVRNS